MQVREKRFESIESMSAEKGSRCRVSRSSAIFSSILVPRSLLLVLLLTLFGLSGCAGPQVGRPTSRPPKATAPEKRLPGESPAPSTPAPPARVPMPQDQAAEPRQATPRTVAALRLTEQARSQLDAGKTDEAIRTLERAMNLNPSNGENFYYLAEAWMKKKNFRQAEEFNRLAAIHLKSDGKWMARVAEQAEKIRKAGD